MSYKNKWFYVISWQPVLLRVGYKNGNGTVLEILVSVKPYYS